MSTQTIIAKPIPALYTVYILRSTVRRASLYIGSTPNPPRRLKQHNGDSAGGASRTSRTSLRPWEMVGLVSGFPSMVAALKFEWALANAHLTQHIPSSSRITFHTQKKRNGHPKRPVHSLTSILSNLHLLLRVPSFGRWPLKVHFFAPDVFQAWNRWCTAAHEKLRKSLPVVTDFEKDAVERTVRDWFVAQGEETHGVGSLDGWDDDSLVILDSNPAGTHQGALGEMPDPTEVTTVPPAWGIYKLPLDYEPIKEYVAKGREIFEFERLGDCVVCHQKLDAHTGLHAVCTNNGCEGVGHLSCWSRHLLSTDDSAADANTGRGKGIIPIQGRCPSCGGEVQWADMMKELSLRLRGTKEVDKLLKVKKKRAVKVKVGAKS
ncbi:hypothetical protein QBC37DRAFT_426888 [Rhypophila decipiens]|uniref:GIY-YIG domain-containing protein n=1 Tax=Rhypophila decipiens TaxID=261697 RepID=A0AAN6Y7F0_9PEZI|nr:hypothetical protein QBC37DRAFT_426888 [Rhypophila decipiens]